MHPVCCNDNKQLHQLSSSLALRIRPPSLPRNAGCHSFNEATTLLFTVYFSRSLNGVTKFVLFLFFPFPLWARVWSQKSDWILASKVRVGFEKGRFVNPYWKKVPLTQTLRHLILIFLYLFFKAVSFFLVSVVFSFLSQFHPLKPEKKKFLALLILHIEPNERFDISWH